MSAWVNYDEGLIFYNFSSSYLTVKVLKNTGQCFKCVQDVADIQQLNRVYNIHLRLSEKHILELLLESFNMLNIFVGNGDSNLKILSNISRNERSFSFNWNFPLERSESIVGDVINPLFNSIMMLIQEKSSLESLLKKKDKEINEFKSLGLVLSKKSKLSAPFDADKTLSNVKHRLNSTTDILSNSNFQHVISMSSKICEETSKSAGLVTTKSRNVEPVGVVFDEGNSQPDEVQLPILTDDDLFKTEEDETEETSIRPPDSVVRKKKPRRL